MHFLVKMKDNEAINPLENIKFADGDYLVVVTKLRPISELKEYRAAYFVKLDFLCKEVGEKRYDLHKIIKDEVLLGGSTQSFSIEEWATFLQQFEIWAFLNYNVILP